MVRENSTGVGDPVVYKAGKTTPAQWRQATLRAVIVDAAEAGATLQEIADYVDMSVGRLETNFGKDIVAAWARRTIRLRRAQTEMALKGSKRILDRLTGGTPPANDSADSSP